MASGSGDFERPFGTLLSGNFREVRNFATAPGNGRLRMSDGNRRNGTRFPGFQYGDGIKEVFRSEGPDSRNSCGLRSVPQGKEYRVRAPLDQGRGVGDHAPDAAERTVQREFAQNRDTVEIPIGKPAFFRDDPERDGEIEGRTGFPEFRGSEIDRYAFGRKGESGVPDGGPDAFAAFLDGGVAKPDHGERRESGGYVGFDRYGTSEKAPYGRGKYVFNHEKSAEKGYFSRYRKNNTEKERFVKRESGGLFCPQGANVVRFSRFS